MRCFLIHCISTSLSAREGKMSSTHRSSTVPPTPSSLPRSDSFIRARQPSLDLEHDLLSTRGQRLGGLIRRRSLSVQSADNPYDSDRLDESFPQDRGDRPLAFERAKRLIGESRPIYRWYAVALVSQLSRYLLTMSYRQHFYQDPSMLKKMPKAMYVAICGSNAVI